MVDEKLANYQEVHNWMVGIGFPQSRTQYGTLKSEVKINNTIYW